VQEIYFRAMDRLHRLCVILAGASLIIISLIIPWGVFTRYVLNSASSWPEPAAIVLMIWLSFLSAVVCYREHLHIAVGMIPNALQGSAKRALGFVIEVLMLGANVFLLWFGIKLCQSTWHQPLAEFPHISTGLSYLPVPIGGLLTTFFIVERFLKAEFFPAPIENALETIATE
jgi:TRAP-type C4-dicarboxylate transport system permease small subunit